MLMQGITYNTTMGLVVGVIMLMVPLFMRALQKAGDLSLIHISEPTRPY